MLKILLYRIGKFLARRVTRAEKRYFLNGREISEAEWIINGGLEAEEELDRAIRDLDNTFKSRKRKP
jgi:hypothetical protein